MDPPLELRKGQGRNRLQTGPTLLVVGQVLLLGRFRARFAQDALVLVEGAVLVDLIDDEHEFAVEVVLGEEDVDVIAVRVRRGPLHVPVVRVHQSCPRCSVRRHTATVRALGCFDREWQTFPDHVTVAIVSRLGLGGRRFPLHILDRRLEFSQRECELLQMVACLLQLEHRVGNRQGFKPHGFFGCWLHLSGPPVEA